MKKVLWTVLLSLAALWIVASSAYAAPLWESDTAQTVTQGVTLRRIDRFYKNTWDRIRVLYVDLENENLSLRVLTASDGISGRETTLHMAEQSGAVAAVNGDFFNMTNPPTNMLGMLVQNGQMHSSPSYDTGLANFALLQDNSIVLDYFTFTGCVYSPEGYKSDLFAVNKVPVTTGGVTMLTPAWGKTSTGTIKGIAMTELVVRNDKVTDIRIGMEPTPIPEDGYILVTNGAINGFLADNFKIGDAVEIETELAPEIDKIREATGGGTLLVKDGKVATFTHNVSGYAQRTAVGIDKDGTTLMLVTVDGRMTECEGMTQTELAKLLIELGCDTALNLDGGGSTTMVTRDRFSGELAVQNTLVGSMRKVSTAIGIFEDVPTGSAKKIEARLSKQVVRAGEAVQVEYVLLDKYDNPVSVSASKVKITADRPAKVKGNTVTPSAGGTYTITVAYGTSKQKLTLVSVADYTDIYLCVQSKQMRIGDSVSFTLRGADAYGNTVTIPASEASWSVDGDAFSVENGKVRAIAEGSATLRVQLGDLVAYASLATTEATLYNKPVDIGEMHPDYGDGNGYELYISGSTPKEDTLLKRLLRMRREELLLQAKDDAYCLGGYNGTTEGIQAIKGFSKISINNNLLLTVNNAKGGIKKTDASQWEQLIDAVRGAKEQSIVLLMPKSVYALEENEKIVFDSILNEAVEKGKQVYVVYEGTETDFAMDNGVTYLVCGALENAHTKTFHTDAQRFACLRLTLTLQGVKFEYIC